jgi:hypothetical protein
MGSPLLVVAVVVEVVVVDDIVEEMKVVDHNILLVDHKEMNHNHNVVAAAVGVVAVDHIRILDHVLVLILLSLGLVVPLSNSL